MSNKSTFLEQLTDLLSKREDVELLLKEDQESLKIYLTDGSLYRLTVENLS